MSFEKRLFVNNNIFVIPNDLVDNILIRNDISILQIRPCVETLFIESWNYKLGVYECRSHKKEYIFLQRCKEIHLK